VAKHRIDPSQRVILMNDVPYDPDAMTSFENLQSGSMFPGTLAKTQYVERGTGLCYLGNGKFRPARNRSEEHAVAHTSVFMGEVGLLVVKL
jgi:hypothetical protein